ncbi:MAG: hypothetical protein JWN21_2362, partial [Sphingomonas bacterium]|nr:hypothetical protein [Sphingomonas bacterium]
PFTGRGTARCSRVVEGKGHKPHCVESPSVSR